jgi:hypothetical protein
LDIEAVHVLTLREPNRLSVRDGLRESLDELAPRLVGVCPEEDLSETGNETGEMGR